jgi:hypothetical protein
MPLGTRVLKVTLSMPSGDVVLDQTLDLHVRVRKQALAVQQECYIDVINLSQNFRESLLSQFTAWNKRNIENGTTLVNSNYVNVKVEAGYSNAGQQSITTIFLGQIVLATPFNAPPNQGVRIKCFSQQLSNATFVSGVAPVSASFKEYVIWAGAQMGVDRIECETSYDGVTITNPFASTHVVGTLLIDIQDAYKPNVAAFIDNNTLYVRDANKLITSANTVTVKEFIGMPLWNEWGAEFTAMFDPAVRFPGAAILESVMNPGLNTGSFVFTSIEYDLTSRDVPFYVRASGSPPA